jgi:hypothetical protein
MAVVILAALYSLTLLPSLYGAARLLHKAERATSEIDTRLAENLLLDVLRSAPSSARARIDLAILYFRTSSETDQRKALDLLSGLKINEDNWRRISAVLPDKYRSLFQSEKSSCVFYSWMAHRANHLSGSDCS